MKLETIKIENRDEEFKKKMTDMYNFLASRNMGGGEIHFKDGIVFKCKIDATNWVNKPVIDLTKAESEGKE